MKQDRRNLILGAIKGYSFQDIQPFIRSLIQTGYTGELCLFHQDLSEADQAALLTVDAPFQVNLERFSSIRLRLRSGKVVYPFDGRLSAIHPIYPVVVRAVGRSQSRRYQTAAAIHGVWSSRYFLYYRYLASQSSSYDRVLITDVRDVVFQRNPFEFETDAQLCCFLEKHDRKIADCPINSQLVVQAFGHSAFRQIGHQVVSCSGITLGSFEAMLEYLRAMSDSLLSVKRHTGGIDQGVHNYLLYTRKVANFRLLPNRYAPVMTMSYEDDFRFDSAGRMVDDGGYVFHIVHQYDRHPEVAARLLRNLTLLHP